MGDLVSCETCPVRLRFAKDQTAELTEATHDLAQFIGQPAVDQFIKDELQVDRDIVAGAQDCPGFKPMSKLLRRATMFFDGQSGVDFADNMLCNNPVYHSEEFRNKMGERRKAFEKVIEAAIEKQAPGEIKKAPLWRRRAS